MLGRQPLHDSKVVLDRQPEHEVDRSGAADNRATAQCLLNGIANYAPILGEPLHLLSDPGAAGTQCSQGSFLTDDGWTYCNGVLHLHELPMQALGICQVAHSPSHHSVGFGEREYVHHVVTTHAGVGWMTLVLIREVLVRVVDGKPHAVLGADRAQALQVLSRHGHTRRVARIDNRHHLYVRVAGLRRGQTSLQPVNVRQEVLVDRSQHYAVTATGHLNSHQVVEVIRCEQHRGVLGV
mmetsp:Transcript_10768/g.27824  ORF Transcript_10768/g.27824 Transcript_10768/m.27824 type:complete len:238 (+) Transcript_10768:249-962(+)